MSTTQLYRRTLRVLLVSQVLAGAGLVAALAPPDSMALLTVALPLLGLGWNFGLVGGTALITDAAPLDQRAKTQGTVDLAVALSGATGGMASGFVVASAGYAALSIGGGLLALALIPVLVVERRSALTPTAAGGGSRYR